LASEKRAHRRFRTNRVQLRVPDRAALNATLRDVSEGGLFIETTSPPHVGETARVELFPPGWSHPLLLSGVVVRAELTGYAVRLDALSEKAKAQLKTLVAQVAHELSGPTVKSVTEAQQRLAEMEAELRDAKDKLARVKEDAENNRAYLERALAQAGAQRQRGHSNLVLGMAAGAAFFGGIVAATIASVARTPPPPAPVYGSAVRAPTGSPVRALDEAGPRRPTPLPVAAIFSGEGEADAGAAARDGGHTVAKRPANPASPPRPGTSSGPGADVGRLNFLASGPAVVLLDDERLGATPLRGVSLKPGTYKLQFQCGAGAPSAPRKLDVLPFSETDVEHRCQ
jgi:PilZ domain